MPLSVANFTTRLPLTWATNSAASATGRHLGANVSLLSAKNELVRPRDAAIKWMVSLPEA